jgi:hypothetical protein
VPPDLRDTPYSLGSQVPRSAKPQNQPLATFVGASLVQPARIAFSWHSPKSS